MLIKYEYKRKIKPELFVLWKDLIIIPMASLIMGKKMKMQKFTVWKHKNDKESLTTDKEDK